MRPPRTIVAGTAAAALALGLGAGASLALPAASAETAATAAASSVPLTDATHPDNVTMALQFLDHINKQVRGVERSTLTEQQIATAQGANVSASMIQAGTGTGEILPPFKVNSDLTAWAQTRANELARAGMIDSHKNVWNGAPSWAIQTCRQPDGSSKTCSNMLSNPDYQSGTIVFGPENLAIASTIVEDYARYNPIWSWTDELNTGKSAYGHYLLEITKLGNVAGIGVARVTEGMYAGGIVTVLEVAYEAPGTTHGTTQTVAEALQQLAGANEIQSVAAPAAVTVNSGTDPSSQFPAKVTATYGDGHTADVDVTWTQLEESRYKDRQGGTFTVHGTITGFKDGVDITVKVNPATVTSITAEPATVTVVKGGTIPGLPTTVTVTYSNGDQVAADVTWDTSAVKTDEIGTYTATATVAGQSVNLTIKVVEATITQVANPDALTVPSGTKAEDLAVPTTIDATWSNASTSSVTVAWNQLTDAQKAVLASRAGGDFTLEGRVDGWKDPVTLKVTVTPATATAATLADTDQALTTASGTAPTLAKTATVTWSNGETTQETIDWKPITQDAYSARSGGQFQVQGTVAGLTVNATVTVTPATAEKVTTSLVEVTTQAGTAPVLPETLPVAWSNGDTTNEPVTWDEITAEQYTQSGTFDVAGTVNVKDAPTAATAGGAAVTPSLRVALRAAKAGEPVGLTFPVTARVTVTDKQVSPSEPPTPGATEQPTPGATEQPTPGATEQPTPGATEQPTPGATEQPTKPADQSGTTSAKGVKGGAHTLARTGGSLLILPLAAGLVAAGALLVRRRQG